MNRRTFIKNLAVAISGTSLVGTGVFLRKDNHQEIFSLIKRICPEMIARELVSVQPMSGPIGEVFYLKNNYQPNIACGNSDSQFDDDTTFIDWIETS